MYIGEFTISSCHPLPFSEVESCAGKVTFGYCSCISDSGTHQSINWPNAVSHFQFVFQTYMLHSGTNQRTLIMTTPTTSLLTHALLCQCLPCPNLVLDFCLCLSLFIYCCVVSCIVEPPSPTMTLHCRL